MAKCTSGKLMAFATFHSIANLFPQIMALSVGSISLQAAGYCESFPVNNHFHSKCESFVLYDMS